MARFPTVIGPKMWQDDQANQFDNLVKARQPRLDDLQQRAAPPPPEQPAPEPMVDEPSMAGAFQPPESPLNALASQDTGAVPQPAPDPAPAPVGGSLSTDGAPPESPLNRMSLAAPDADPRLSADRAGSDAESSPSVAPTDDLSRFDALVKDRYADPVAKAAPTPPTDDLAKFDAHVADRYGISPDAERKQVAGEAQQDDDASDYPTPEPGVPPQNVGIRTPFGPQAASIGIPFQAQKPTRDQRAEENVREGRDITSVDQMAGPFVRPAVEELDRVARGEQDPTLKTVLKTGAALLPSGEATQPFMKQGEGNPLLSEGMPGLQIQPSEKALARAFANGLVEQGGSGGSVRAVAHAAGEVAGGGDALQSAASRRMYHGTGSAFDRPDAAKFGSHELYGPGYYLTDAPDVATSYAERAPDSFKAGRDPERLRRFLADAEQRGDSDDIANIRRELEAVERARATPYPTGPNVRAVDIPNDLRLLDAEAPASVDDADRAASLLAVLGQRRGDPSVAARFHAYWDASTKTGQSFYEGLLHALGDDKQQVNKLLNGLGYDGVQYSGRRVGRVDDDAGNVIDHTAVAVFPEAMEKLRNAISGTAGGIVDPSLRALADLKPPALENVAGALGGAVGSQALADEDESTGERIGRAVGGALLGAGAVRGVKRALRGQNPLSLDTGVRRELGIGPASAYEPDPSDFAAYMQHRKDAAQGGERSAPRSRQPVGKAAEEAYYQEQALKALEEGRAQAPVAWQALDDAGVPDDHPIRTAMAAAYPELVGGEPLPLAQPKAPRAPKATPPREPRAPVDPGPAAPDLGPGVRQSDLPIAAEPRAGSAPRDPGPAAPELGPDVEQARITDLDPPADTTDYAAIARAAGFIGDHAGAYKQASGVARQAVDLMHQMRRPTQTGLPGITATKASTALDKVQTARYVAMLSDWAGRLNDLGTGALESVARPTETILGGLAFPNARGRAMVAGGVRDLGAQALAIPEAARAAAEAFRTGERSFGSSRAQGAPTRAFGDGPLGRAATVVTDAMGASDEFFQAMNVAGAAANRASREAVGKKGVTAADILRAPSADFLERVRKDAEAVTYAGDPGALPRWIADGRRLPGAAGAALTFLVPFAKVAANIGKAGAAMTARATVLPGVAEAGYHFARGNQDAGRVALGKTGLAAGLAFYFANEALAGRLTDSGPADPDERAKLEAAGWQANSWQPPGSNRYVSIQNLGRFALPVMAIANAWGGVQAAAHKRGQSPQGVADAVGALRPEDAGVIVGQMGKALEGVNYLRGVTDLIGAKNLGDAAVRTGTQIVGSFVPAAAGHVERVLDPTERATDTLADRVKSKIPGLSSTVPAEPGLYGDDRSRQKDDTVAQLLLPWRSSRPTTDPVAREVARLTQAGQSVEVKRLGPNEKYDGVKQAPDARRAIQKELGEAARVYILQTIADPAYASKSDKGKAESLNKQIALAYKLADAGLDEKVERTPAGKALLAYNAIPHYEGIDKTQDPAAIRRQNLVTAEAKALLADYRRQYPGEAMDRLEKDNPAAARIAGRPEVPSDYLKRKKAELRTQLGADVPEADQPVLGAGNRVIP